MYSYVLLSAFFFLYFGEKNNWAAEKTVEALDVSYLSGRTDGRKAAAQASPVRGVMPLFVKDSLFDWIKFEE